MSLSSLNDYESYTLLRLSYYDLPTDIRLNENLSYSLSSVIKYMKREVSSHEPTYSEIQKIEEVVQSNPKLQDIKLIAYQNHNPNDGNNSNGESNSGFVGYAFADEEGNSAALFRGSEPHFETDWLSNIQAGLGQEITQQEEANAFYEKYVQNYQNSEGISGERFLLGHSKGGNLASDVLVQHYTENISAYVVNGAPLYWWDLHDGQRKALDEQMTFIAHEWDVVSGLGYAPYVDKTVKTIRSFSEYRDEDLFYPHGLSTVSFNAEGELKNVREGASFLREGGSLLTVLLSDAIDFKNKVKNKDVAYAIDVTLTRMLYLASKGLIDEVIQVRNMAVQTITTLKHVSVALVAEVSNFFDDVLSFVETLFTKGFTWKVGGGGSSEEHIKVDISRLMYYADRLRRINRKTRAVNNQIDLLYWKADFFDLDSVFLADVISSFPNRMNQAVSYLTITADMMQATERKLTRKASTIS
ncbi:DUF2974 domain-containing protein [Radiobacillus kanasensis]|uniref:Mbeg1-like protein n=1 Tax=Radiobacillus kanasensis TaxID=2844358 RepID=UPI001E2D7386|nr:Mbeg1-like protein [Radiobacillus kanasensis]UFT99205.1 DUF2974 domain-containing protein [Radiobacillus kanasensis]